ncbi:MAG: S8 family serine peptidase [Thermoplasmata archaeon]|nr:S8 family serine peptidase [Thermoplasmata archaeon]
MTDRAAVNPVLEAVGLQAIRGMELDGLPTVRMMDLTSSQIEAIASSEGTMKIMTYEMPTYDEDDIVSMATEEAPVDPPETEDLDVDYLHGAIDAWMNGFTGNGVNVAVIDTGFDMAHPDLQGQQARYQNPWSNYVGWPIAYDDLAAQYWMNGMIGGWVADTSAWAEDLGGFIDFDGRIYAIDALEDVDGNPVSSQSGWYHVGYHTDANLASLWGETPGVLVVDANSPFVYDTVYVDIDDDWSFNDEKACTQGDEISYYDFWDADLGTENWDDWDGGDGYADLSGGMIYWISDGVYDLPGSDWLYGGWPTGMSPRPESGMAVAFVGEFYLGESHGTMTSSAALAYPNTMGGMLAGMAPNAKLIAIPFTGDTVASWLFAALGDDASSDGIDDAKVVSNSYGWSDTAIDSGYQDFDMYVGYISMFYSSETLWCWSTGNGGPGYGTAHTPTEFSSVHVGAGTTMQYRYWLGYESDYGYTKWGDVIPFSNSGPTRQGKLNAEVIASGAYSLEPAPLNQWDAFGSIGDGSQHFQIGSGTSHATPTVAGAVALGYEAYYIGSGGWWPDIITAKAKLMAAADDMHYDPFKQGSGWLNANTYTQHMAELSGTETLAYMNEPIFTKAALYPGFVYGNRFETFPNFLLPGETDQTHVLSTTNYDPVNPALVDVTSELLLKTGGDNINFLTATAGDTYLDITSYVPATTDLLRVTMYIPFSQFDPDMDYNSDLSYWLEAHDWVDIDLDGAGWTSTGFGELFRYTVDGEDSNYNQIMLKDPIDRTNDGLILRVRGIAGAVGTDISLQLDYYELQTFPWITFRLVGDTVWQPSLSFVLGPSSTQDWEVNVTVPIDVPIGTYGAAIYIDDGMRVQNFPVVINVPADDFVFEFGGASYFDTPYNNEVSGLADKGWRFEVGDWRMYWAMPMSTPPASNANLVVTLNWTELPTDMNLHVLAPIWNWGGWPQWDWPFGPSLLMTPLASSDEKYLGAGTFGIYTNTGRAQEVLGAPFGEWWDMLGLGFAPFEIVVRCPVMAGSTPSDTVSGYTTWISMNYYDPTSISLWAPQPGGIPLEGEIPAVYDITVPGEVEVRGNGVGPYKRDYYEEPVWQDSLTGNFAQDLANAGYSRWVEVEDSNMLSVEVDEMWDAPDIDMGVWYDADWDGVAELSEPYWYIGAGGSHETLVLDDPDDGRYIIKVLGYTVTGSPGWFWMTVLVGVPGYILATDLDSPVSSGMHNFNVSYKVPAEVGVYEGYATFGFMGSDAMYRIDFSIEVLDWGAPEIIFSQPEADEYMDTATLTLQFWANDYVQFYSGIDWGTLSVWLDGTIDLLSVSWWGYDSGGNVTLSYPLALREGQHYIGVSVADIYWNWAGNGTWFTVDSVIETFDAEFYDLGTSDPIRDGSKVAMSMVGVRGQTDPDAAIEIWTATDTYTTTATWEGYYDVPDIALAEGVTVVTVMTTNLAGIERSLSKMIISDTVCTLVVMDLPERTADSALTVEGLTEPGASVTVAGVPASVEADGAWSADIVLLEGANVVVVDAMDNVGNTASESISVELDTTPPLLAIASPADGSNTSEPSVAVAGTTDADATVTVNGVLANNVGGDWWVTVVLSEGWNTILVSAEDDLGNSVSDSIAVEYIPPVYVTPEQLQAVQDMLEDLIANLTADLEENVTALTDMIGALAGDLQDNVTMLLDLISALQDALDDNVTDLQTQLNALNSTVQADVADLQSQLDSLNTSLASEVASLLALIAALNDDLNSTEDDLQSQIDALTSDLASDVAALTALIAALNDDLNTTEDGLQGQIDALTAEIAADVAALNALISGLESDLADSVAALNGDIADLLGDINGVRDALDENVTDIQDQIDQLEQTDEDVQNQADDTDAFASLLMYLTLALFVIAIVLIVVAWVTISRKMGGGGSAQSMEEVEEGPSEVEKEFEALESEIEKDEL